MLGIFALYKCLRCGHEFVGSPGPTECQGCGHSYVKWINYSEKEFGIKNELPSSNG
jgi:hypothetical protein